MPTALVMYYLIFLADNLFSQIRNLLFKTDLIPISDMLTIYTTRWRRQNSQFSQKKTIKLSMVAVSCVLV
jgi:hypothetical protein